MANSNQTNYCSTCNKLLAQYFCNGCDKYFCSKDLKLHEQSLLMDFDNEVVNKYNELIEQIKAANTQDIASSKLVNEIEQWKIEAMANIEKVAEIAKKKVIALCYEPMATINRSTEVLGREIRWRREEEYFFENDIERLRKKIGEILDIFKQIVQQNKSQEVRLVNRQINWHRAVYIQVMNEVFPLRCPSIITILPNSKWCQNGVTVAGGNGHGNDIRQLWYPYNFLIHNDETVYVADTNNHRIVEWIMNENSGRVVAGGNGKGSGVHQLSDPRDVIVDEDTDCLIISDSGNRRVVRWPRQNGTRGETIISNIDCRGLTMDESGSLYVVDSEKAEVRRYKKGNSEVTVVAGGNGRGDRLDQFNNPGHVFVDRTHSIYVSDYGNHRVMNWTVGANTGIVVAGGHGGGNELAQLSYPEGIVVDQSGTVYVADGWNARIMCWPKGAIVGSVIIGKIGTEKNVNALHRPVGLSFDTEGNIYILDWVNHRLQRFELIRPIADGIGKGEMTEK